MRRRTKLVATLAAVASVAAVATATAGWATDEPSDPVAATVRVAGTACGEPGRGVGVVVDRELVLTAAHVVAGMDEVEVDGWAGRVVELDPNRDLALLAVAELDRPSVEVGSSQQGGDVGVLVAVDATETIVRHAYEVRRWIWATGDDIYGVDGARRRVDELDTTFFAGWSGSGLFGDDGHLVGIAVAQSRRQPGVAYAVSAAEISAFLAESDLDVDDPSGAGPCRDGT